ncbi:hypothetical protein G5576_113658 [Homo sapiens]|uniref:Chromosome 8 open reading frame 74 n=1 Tax=Homo sapiens TaxID=9606 RepID=A0AAG2TI40_HUMAN|nr:hypothetical protein KI723_080126 [Homo sapiens]KAI2548867.1 hypothetical protein KI723_080126 [Homo sapiens]KAI4009530.1 hypothetical protein G5576_113658 [Homo sapiens]KAI4009531.1 hypothetical protein G5576_113658 [Homo sapiens]
MALLTPQGVKEVFQFQRPQGRERLRRLLNWEEFDEQRDSRRSILLDTLYESIIFAVGKGFPWVEVAQVVKFTEELLRETKGSVQEPTQPTSCVGMPAEA